MISTCGTTIWINVQGFLESAAREITDQQSRVHQTRFNPAYDRELPLSAMNLCDSWVASESGQFQQPDSAVSSDRFVSCLIFSFGIAISKFNSICDMTNSQTKQVSEGQDVMQFERFMHRVF
jgi:hypothetical protein